MYTRFRTRFAAFAALCCAFIPAFYSAAAHAATEQRALSGFTGIDAGGSVNVDVRIGDEFFVEVDTRESLEDIETEVRNGTLHIDVERDSGDWGGSWNDEYNVVVVMPSLDELEVSGGVDLRVTGIIRGEELVIGVSGGADVEAEVAVERIEIEVSGGADVDISGTAQSAVARASGGADLDARNLEVKDAELRASGGADLAMAVTGTLDARASGGADIDYYGEPKMLDEDASGSSDITGH